MTPLSHKSGVKPDEPFRKKLVFYWFCCQKVKTVGIAGKYLYIAKRGVRNILYLYRTKHRTLRHYIVPDENQDDYKAAKNKLTDKHYKAGHRYIPNSVAIASLINSR